MTQEAVLTQSHQKDHVELFKKEVFTLKNDLYYKFFENKESRWFFDISYKPHQTLSGDCYSVREIENEKIFVFVIDAMGKGLNASITSIMSANFLNYLVDLQKTKNYFSLKHTIEKYIRFAQTSLFDDEIICASFVVFDFKNNTMESALFGMPPILLAKNDGSLEKIKANNLPISKYISRANTVHSRLFGISKLLIYSDGLNEATLGETEPYKKYLEEDFQAAANYKSFLQTAQNKVDTFDDDMTFLYIEKEQCDKCKIKTFSIKSQENKFESALQRVEDFLLYHGMTPQNEAYLSNAFMEMLINAYEHGNLQISHDEKSKALSDGTFEELLSEREAVFGDRKIIIHVHVEILAKCKTYRIEIIDEGEGFDTNIIRNKFFKTGLYSGRGLVMTSKMVDAFYYNRKGNKVILKKFQKSE